MTLTDCTVGLRVRCPGGVCGTIVRVSPTLKMSVLVARDDGAAMAYRPGELTKVEPPAFMGVPLP